MNTKVSTPPGTQPFGPRFFMSEMLIHWNDHLGGLLLAGFVVKTYREVDLCDFLDLWKYMKILPIPAH